MNSVFGDDEMVVGYLAGLDSGSFDLPDCHKDRSPAFKHGWMNGRDDRLGQPREKADVLRRRARMIAPERGIQWSEPEHEQMAAD